MVNIIVVVVILDDDNNNRKIAVLLKSSTACFRRASLLCIFIFFVVNFQARELFARKQQQLLKSFIQKKTEKERFFLIEVEYKIKPYILILLGKKMKTERDSGIKTPSLMFLTGFRYL